MPRPRKFSAGTSRGTCMLSRVYSFAGTSIQFTASLKHPLKSWLQKDSPLECEPVSFLSLKVRPSIERTKDTLRLALPTEKNAL